MSRKDEGQRADIYTRITDKIIEDLTNGVRPWVKPWNTANTTAVSLGRCAITASPVPA